MTNPVAEVEKTAGVEEAGESVKVALPQGFEGSPSLLHRVLAAVNPPTKKLTEGKDDTLYAADVFLPERLVRNCRVLALTVAALLSILTFLIPADALAELKRHVLEVGFLSSYELPLSRDVFTALRAGFAALFFVLAYPRLVRIFFGASLKLKLSEKREKIDRNLYTALCMLAGFGRGGIPVSKAVELVARSNLEGVREEFAKIHTSVSILGYDMRTAMLRVALTTPSERLAHFLKGFVSYLERSKNYGDYVEEYLQLDNVNRRIELAAYGEKLRQLSAMYVTLVTLLASLSIISLSLNIMQPGQDYSIFVVYIGLPAVCAGMTVLYYVGCPDKGAERSKKRGPRI